MLLNVQVCRFFISDNDGTQCRYTISAEILDLTKVNEFLASVQRMPLPDMPGIGGNWREIDKAESGLIVQEVDEDGYKYDH